MGFLAWGCCDPMQDPALGLVELHTTGLGLSLQTVQIPLQSPPTFQKINTPNQLGVIHKVTFAALDPLIKISLTKIINRAGPNNESWPQY